MSSILDVRRILEPSLLSTPNVIGVGHVGDTLRIYVEGTPFIPEIIAGYKVEVVKVGKIRALPLLLEDPLLEDEWNDSLYLDKWPNQSIIDELSLRPRLVERTIRARPALGGMSVGHYGITAGTLGAAIVIGGKVYGLSNNHVLANASSIQSQNAQLGDAVLQPGQYDGGTVENDVIGTLSNFRPLDTVGDNLADCALFTPTNEVDLSAEILEVGTPTGFGQAAVGMNVAKSGRTTGMNTGQVQDVDATINVDYGTFTAKFTHQIVTSYMAEGGDSIGPESEVWIRTVDGVEFLDIEKVWEKYRDKSFQVLSSSARDQHIMRPVWHRANILRHECKKKTYRVWLTGHTNIVVSEDHSLMVGAVNKGHEHGFKFEPKPTSELRIGDRIPVLNELPDFSTHADIPSIEAFPGITTTGPALIDSDLLTLAGLWLGDGSHDSRGYCTMICHGNDADVVEFLEGFGSKYGLTVTPKPTKTERGSINYTTRLYSGRLIQGLKHLGFTGSYSNKQIPVWLFTAPKEDIAAFLRGYFSADGAAPDFKNRPVGVQLSSVNEHLVHGTSLLLNRLGIHNRYDRIPDYGGGFSGGKGIYKLTINRRDSVLAFAEKVGFIQRHKQAILWKAAYRGGFNTYPFEANKVVDIEELDAGDTLYDMKVPSSETFIANNILCHNSGSVLLNNDTKEIVALLFAGSEYVTIHNHIDHVFEALNTGPSTITIGGLNLTTLLPLAAGLGLVYLLR